MMNQNDIGKLFFDKCARWGVEMYIFPNIPLGEITKERIVITPSPVKTGKFWHESQVKINWCVPDIDSEENSPRLDVVLKLMECLYQGIGEHENRYYTYRKASVGTGADEAMRCHFANLTLTFKIQNLL